MYSDEIRDILEKNKNYISNEEYFEICNTSPQIRRVIFDKDTHDFYIETNEKDGSQKFKFKVYKKTK